MKKLIYLAGPITEEDASKGHLWRSDFARMLDHDIQCISPLRDVADTTLDDKITLEKVRHGHSTVTRDRMDVMRADLIVANFLGSKKVSIGTVGEIFWADAFRKPVILVMEKGNPHQHLMLLEIAGWHVTSLREAVERVNLLLSAARSNSATGKRGTRPR